MTDKTKFQQSFVAYLDILGFTKRFPNERDSCIELISFFSEYNGQYFIQKDDGQRQVRPSAISLSDSICISIPVKIEKALESDDIYMPIMAFLSAISFFSFHALSKGFYIRGAISYGDMYHTDTVIAGDPYIEAVEHEKVAYYPRIILTPTAIDAIKRIPKEHHFYGWKLNSIISALYFSRDIIDNTEFFDWFSFFRRYQAGTLAQSGGPDLEKIRNNALEKLNQDIETTKDINILQRLYWMKKYIQFSLGEQ
jgi:hypothetical protein